VVEALEAGDVLVAQLDVAGERVAEQREVVRLAGLLPGLLAERLRARELHRQLGGHARGLLGVAARPADEPHVVGVGVLAVGPRLECGEQPAQLGVGLADVDELRERRRLLGARLGPAGRHDHVLVPEQQRAEAVEVAQLGEPLPQGGELRRRPAHRPACA
jgi:hypothetical protein